MTAEDRKQRADAGGTRQEPIHESWVSAQLRDRIQRVLPGNRKGATQTREPEPSPQPDLEAEP